MSDAPKPDAGTVDRFRTVMLPHLDAAYGYARWLTRDPVQAQDVAQEAMLRAQRKGPLTEKTYRDALARNHRLSRKDGIDAVMDRLRLDALVAPTGSPHPRRGPANGRRHRSPRPHRLR